MKPRPYSPPSPMPHPHDPRIDHGYIVWHADPNLEALIEDLVRNVDPSVFIETGTHMGWTAHWMARRFIELPILTCEVNLDYAAKSKENLAEFGDQVVVSYCDSREFLRQLKARGELAEWDSHGVPFFWLDAHWWPPVPLRDECAVVATLPRYVCMLDDFECEAPHFDGDVFTELDGRRVTNNLAYVADILGPTCYRPAYPSWPGCKGYGLFMKGVDCQPPARLMKLEKLW